MKTTNELILGFIQSIDTEGKAITDIYYSLDGSVIKYEIRYHTAFNEDLIEIGEESFLDYITYLHHN